MKLFFEDLKKTIQISPTEDLKNKRRPHLPSDDDPNYTYGVETKHTTTIGKLVSNYYQREYEMLAYERIYEKEKKEYEEKLKNLKANSSQDTTERDKERDKETRTSVSEVVTEKCTSPNTCIRNNFRSYRCHCIEDALPGSVLTNEESNEISNFAKTKAILNYSLSMALSLGNIEIKDYEKVEKKLLDIIKDGKENVHIISDFDMTITKYWDNDKRSPSCYDFFSRSSKISDNYRKKYMDLKEKYYPIEISPDLTNEEKLPYMIEWWGKCNEALLEEKTHKDAIADIVSETELPYRPGIKDVLYCCKEKNIPFLIFSAGVKNVIKEKLIQANLLFDNMIVVSNKMAYNKNTGIYDKFIEPLYHVFNKDYLGIEGTKYEKLIENRRNVIICGDSLGDIKMADGVKHENCLSIGLLNINKEQMLEKYKDTFDIVITDDGSIHLLYEILRIIN